MTNNQILHYVGHDGEQSVNSAMTQRQIDQLKALRCDLVTDEGEALTWLDFDNPDEPQTLLPFFHDFDGTLPARQDQYLQPHLHK